jgi:hypothetical protein
MMEPGERGNGRMGEWEKNRIEEGMCERHIIEI